MLNKDQAMVLASFAADSLALGVHWIYNTNVIDKKWGRVENYIRPQRSTYHPTKDLGALTHYGDQTMVLLESVTERSGFDLDVFAQRWQQFFKTYDGYFDSATKTTLEKIATGSDSTTCGSQSEDIAGAARIAPLVYVYQKDLELLTESVRAQTAFTHNNIQGIDAAEYFARFTWRVLHGEAPIPAVKNAMDEGFDRQPFSQWIEKGLQSTAEETRRAIKEFGQMCEIEAAFPCVVHLISKYESDLRTAIIENAMAGGDSAGRGLIVGQVLGAYLGSEAIPDRWLSELKAYEHIIDLLNQIRR
jgi:ADP-ribosylglycohydrolase